jgi:subtilisin-like proprotein convertase family protein/environmental stress-induced protein Ves
LRNNPLLTINHDQSAGVRRELFMKKISALILISLSLSVMASPICVAPGLSIPDNNPAGINSDIVSSESGAIASLEMSLDITHTWVGDLIINLTHVESGTSIELVNRANGVDATFGCSSENIQTGVNDDAPVSLQEDCVDGGQAVAYPEPAYTPNNPLATFIGEAVSGTWRLNVSDNAGDDHGTLNEWCLLPTVETHSIGGTVSGLEGSGLVLQNNGGDDLAVAANGAFSFATELAGGEEYVVTVAVQPQSPLQTCTVSNGTGTVTTANVTDIEVTCVTETFSIGGLISGLEGSGLVLQNNGGDDLAVAANGSFSFATELEEGEGYAVTVSVQPENPLQICTVSNATGTVATADITDIDVTCVTETFGVGGTVSGLEGSGLVLQNNGGDDLTVAANGAFAFATELADGSGYSVTVSVQPSNPLQTCSVSNGSGTVNGADVTTVEVTCQVQTFTIGGTLSGLTGSLVILQNNGTDDLPIVEDGPFTFDSALDQGESYNVTILLQPEDPLEACVVDNGSGTVGSSNVDDVLVTCEVRPAEIFQDRFEQPD